MTPRRTMAVAQQLYEGVDISGEGTVGLITYMRTDSLRLSEEALAAAQEFITDRYGAGRTIPASPRRFKTRRPARRTRTRPSAPAMSRLTPEHVRQDLTQRAVPALQADLEPLRGLPDGQCRL